jgi:hypothetical protein
MSFRTLSALNSPVIVTAAGVAIAVGVPLIPTGALSLGVLQVANILAFCTNVAAVSVPGRIDGAEDAKMRQGDPNPDSSTTRLIEENNTDDPNARRNRMLLRPAGWAFAIWGPIYLGEAIFCAAQYLDGTTLAAALPAATAPFVAANLFQSLWCASFRPSYNHGWHKYMSAVMLGGTALSLSAVPSDLSLYFVPMVMHFGWTTAATLVNLNGSLAMSDNVSDSKLVATGHASSVLATILGTGLTLSQFTTPVYGLTVAWALAAVGYGVRSQTWPNETLQKGARVQRGLCWTGSFLCFAAAAFIFFCNNSRAWKRNDT